MPSFTIVALLYLIPTIVLLKNYLLIELKDYLVFAIIFILSTISTVLTEFENSHLISQSTYLTMLLAITILNLFAVVILCMMILGNKLTKIVEFINYAIFFCCFLITIFLGMISVILNPDGLSMNFVFFQIVITQVQRLTMGGFILFTFRTVEPVKKTKRNRQVNIMWQSIGVIQIITALSIGVHVMLSILIEPNPSYPLEISSIPFNSYQLTLLLSNVFTGLIATLISIFYPEAMLFTGEQLLRAGKLYKLSENNELTKDKGKFFPLTKNALNSYIQSLPPELLRKK